MSKYPILKGSIYLFFIFSTLCLSVPYCFAVESNTLAKSQTAWELSTSDKSEQAGNIKTNGTALIVIDFQNFNANKKGFLGYLFDDRNHAIAKTQSVIKKARKAGIPIIYLNTILNPKEMPDTVLFNKLKKSLPLATLSQQEKAWNFAVIDELKPIKNDYIVVKGAWSNGFHRTNLKDILRTLKTKTLIITGVAEPIAIYGTFLGAWDEGLETILIEDCIMASGTNPTIQETIHNFSKDVFYPLMGAKVTTSDNVKFIK